MSSTRDAANKKAIPSDDQAIADAAASAEVVPGSAVPTSRWDRQTKRTVLVILLAAVIFAIWLSRDVLSWLIIAAIISYLISPVVGLIARFKVPRSLATVIVFVILAVIMVLVPVLLAPVITDQLTQLASFDVSNAATSLFNGVLKWINDLPDQVTLIGISIPTTNVVNQLEEGVQQATFVPTLSEVLSYLQSLVSTATGIAASTAALSLNVAARIVSAFAAIIIIYFMSLYMTRDMLVIRSYFQSLFPSSFQPELSELMRRIGYIWASFFRGQIVLSLAVGTITYVVLTIVGMPGALVLAIIAGVLEVVPQFGPVIATIPAVIVALIQGSPVLAEYGVSNFGFALIIVGIYFVIQQVEGSVLVPRIIGDSVNLHPVIVIMGVMVGLSAFGILGAFLAAPTLASMRVVGGYVHAKLLDYPPFQTPIGRDRRRQPYRRRVRGDQPTVEASLRAASVAASQGSPASPVPLPELPPGSPAEGKDLGDSSARPSTAAR